MRAERSDPPIHRYEPGHGKGGEYMGMEEQPDGHWCAWDDVQAALAPLTEERRELLELVEKMRWAIRFTQDELCRVSARVVAEQELARRNAAAAPAAHPDTLVLDAAIDLIVELGGTIDGAIAAHLLPGVTGKAARALSLKSRKWLAANAAPRARRDGLLRPTDGAAEGSKDDGE